MFTLKKKKLEKKFKKKHKKKFHCDKDTTWPCFTFSLYIHYLATEGNFFGTYYLYKLSKETINEFGFIFQLNLSATVLLFEKIGRILREPYSKESY